MNQQRKRIKEIELPMEFNPGTKKYEPVLPLKETQKKLNQKIGWKYIILITIGMILLTGAVYFIGKYLLK